MEALIPISERLGLLFRPSKYVNQIAKRSFAYKDLSCQYQSQSEQLSSTECSWAALAQQHEEKVTLLNKAGQDLLLTQEILSKTADTLSETEGNLGKLKVVFSEQTRSLLQVEESLGLRKEQAELIQSILSTPPESISSFDELKKFLNRDFLDFADDENSLPDEASAIVKLKRLEKDLEEIVYFRKTAVKTIGAIGGGFSSGKSSFINSFLKDEIQLSTDVNPTTALPAFVVQSDIPKICGITSNGGIVEVGLKTYQNFSHQYLKDLGFDIKDIMPVLAIETEFNDDVFEHICIIDTPGYNSAGHESEEDDKAVAREQMHNAHFIIWSIGLCSNGTIPQTDIVFLEELELDGKELYIILNKADLKSLTEIEEIIEVVQETLDDADIEFAGISAYDSYAAKELSHHKCCLQNFLKSQNKPSNNLSIIKEEFVSIFACYKKALTKDRSRLESMSEVVGKMIFDAYRLESNAEQMAVENDPDKGLMSRQGFMADDDERTNESLEEKLIELRGTFATGKIEEQLTKLSQLGKEFTDLFTKLESELKRQ